MTRIVLTVFVALPVAVAAPVPKEDDAARMVRIYGTRADPKDDATYKMVGDALHVLSPARELPPPEVRGELPTPEQRALWNWKPTPAEGSRVWREVSGDFTATVRVSFRPPAPDVGSLPRVAGLVAWWGDKDHAGVIRSEQRREAFQQLLAYPGRVRTTNGALPGIADAAYLRLIRKGNLVTGAYSRDGKDWTEFLPDEVEWKGNVKVGVYAKHFTDAPFAVTFDEYTLTLHKN